MLLAETGAPVRRAQVRASSGAVRGGRLATTDSDGRFELRDLPAGRWTLSASKAGLVTLQYGQRRPLETGQAIDVRDGQTLERVDIVLPRGSAIGGHVFDEFGEAVAGARVQVLRYQIQRGVRRLVPTGGGDQTDDTGSFRVYGLAPGDYFVTATLRSGAGADDGDGTTYAPTYYPGVSNPAEAQAVTVGVGQEQNSVNFSLLQVRTVRVSGMAVGTGGAPLGGGMVSLIPGGDALAAFNIGGGATRVRGDGSFTLTNVTPGLYTLTAVTGAGRRGGAGDAAGLEFASIPLAVGGEDITGVTLVTTRGASLTGRVVADERASSPLRMAGLQVVSESARPGLQTPAGANRGARVSDDATFTMNGLIGSRLLRLTGLPRGWMLKAVMLGASDVTDTPLEFRGSEQVTGVTLVVTDRLTEVTGTVTTRGQATSQYTVVVFPEDQEKWAFPTRHVQAARPDQQGTFRLAGLPGGERYLAAAVDYVETGEAFDPQLLASLRGQATPFVLAEGESKTLALTLVTR